jgi:type II secretory pathway pseudopilin PulG
MNFVPPPNFPDTPGGPSKTSGLAVASLILGLLGFCSMGVTGIGAVICGHLAHSQIQRSGGRETGGGMAIAGLITGYLSFLMVPLAILASIALPAMGEVSDRRERDNALSNARQIGTACRIYAGDHQGRFPVRLQELVPDYLPDPTILDCRYPDRKNPVPYDYFGGSENDPPRKVLIASPKVANKGRVFVYVDGGGEAKSKLALKRDGDPAP